jgi:hypothetical protein
MIRRFHAVIARSRPSIGSRYARYANPDASASTPAVRPAADDHRPVTSRTVAAAWTAPSRVAPTWVGATRSVHRVAVATARPAGRGSPLSAAIRLCAKAVRLADVIDRIPPDRPAVLAAPLVSNPARRGVYCRIANVAIAASASATATVRTSSSPHRRETARFWIR